MAAAETLNQVRTAHNQVLVLLRPRLSQVDVRLDIEWNFEPRRRVRRLSSLRLQQVLGPGGERSECVRLRRV